MPIYRKDEQGLVYKTAGNAVQRWNDRLFLTEHTYDEVENKDYYDIEALANKYIMGLTDYTEFQLYFTEANQTQNVYIRFGGKSLRVTRSDGDPLGIGYLRNRASFYTKQASIDNAIWMDRLLQPPLDTYRGGFTYAVLTWDQDSIPQPNVGDTAIALDTNVSYEWDEGNQEWDLTGELPQPSNGWYWQIDFFPDYNFGNGKIVWDGGSEDWSIYTARVPLPDEETIVTDATTRKMKVAIKPAASIVPNDGSINEFASTQAVIDYAQRKIEFTDSDEVEPVYDKDVVIIVDSTDEVIKKIKTKIGEVVNTYELPHSNRPVCSFDVQISEVNYEVSDNTEKTFQKPGGVSSISLTFPEEIYHGFLSSVNIVVGSLPINVSFLNNSSYSLKIMKGGSQMNDYTAPANKTVCLFVFCDNINVYCYINEV